MTTTIESPVFQNTRTVPPLHAGELHLWLVPLDELSAPASGVLAASELVRAERFHHELDRRRYLASRAALRELLAAYAAKSPSSLRFVVNPFGKPSLPDSLLRFNLSHSDGMMLLAVTHGREVGVDLEAMRENLSFEMLSDHYFTPEIQWELRTTPESQRRAKFFELWTRAEAQLKVRGLGLDESLRFDDAERFTLHSFIPAEGFMATLAVEGGDFDLSCWRWLN